MVVKNSPIASEYACMSTRPARRRRTEGMPIGRVPTTSFSSLRFSMPRSWRSPMKSAMEGCTVASLSMQTSCQSGSLYSGPWK